MEPLERCKEEMQYILRHNVSQMQCTDTHLSVLTSCIPILLKWNHALNRCMPVSTSRLISSPFPQQSVQEKPLSTWGILPWTTASFYFTYTCNFKGTWLAPNSSPNPSGPKSVYSELKIIQANCNLKKISAWRNYLTQSFNLLSMSSKSTKNTEGFKIASNLGWRKKKKHKKAAFVWLLCWISLLSMLKYKFAAES